MIGFLHGFILAFGLILPLGPQNVFVFNQGALHRRFINALPAILTAALCDTILILLAIFGVSVVVLTVAWLKTVVFMVGFIFLIFIGWQVWKSVPAMDTALEKTSPLRQVVFAASVSLLNPHAILDTIGVIGTGSLAYSGKALFLYTFACILVSWFWFLGLAVTGRLIGEVDQEGRIIRALNKASALIIWGVAVYFAIQIVQSF